MKHKIRIAGVPIYKKNYSEVLGDIEKILKKESKHYLVTVNPEMILNAQEDDHFLDFLKNSPLNTADGIGVLWASYYLNLPKKKGYLAKKWELFQSLARVLFYPKSIKKIIPQRVTGSDLIPKITQLSEEKGWKLFFLGAGKGIAKKAIQNLKKKYPKTKFSGYYSGSPEIQEEAEIIDRINKALPDILFVAYGSPEQEMWIYRNLFKTKTVKLAIGVGGSFDFLAGNIKRAPVFFQKIGIEWAWRLFLQPKRINRIWKATYHFIRLIYKEKYKK